MVRWKLTEGALLNKETTYTYYVYFDTTENGNKDPVNYSMPKEYIICAGSDGGGNGDFHYAYNLYNGSFSAWTDNATADYERRVHIADFDNDGDYDFFLADDSDNRYEYWENNGDSSWDFTNTFNYNEPGTWGGMCQGDYNEDGYLDLVVQRVGGELYLLRNDGDGTFTEVDLGYDIGTAGERQVACGDFNGDSNMDIIANTQYRLTYLYLGDGTGTASFTDAGAINSRNLDSHAMFVVDYDYDGDLDVFISNAAAYMYLYRNQGTGTFTEIYINTGTGLDKNDYGDGSVWDFNNDGILDFSRGDYSGAPSPAQMNWGNGDPADQYGFDDVVTLTTLDQDNHMDCSGPEYLKDITITTGIADSSIEIAGAINTDTSYTLNNGSTEFYSYLSIQIQYYNGSAWTILDTIVNGSYGLSPNEVLNLRAVFNSNSAWNTSNHTNGTYRIYLQLSSDNGTILQSEDGSFMNASYVFTIFKDEEPPKYWDFGQQPPGRIYKGQTLTYYAYWTDNFVLSQAWLATNETGIWTNSTLAPIINLTGNESWSNYTVVINSTIPPGILGWRIYADDYYENLNMTPINLTEIWTWIELNQSIAAPNQTYTFEDVTIRCQVVDYNYSIPVAGVNVTFDTDFYADIGWATTNSSGWATLVYQYEDPAGVDTIHCRIKNQQFYNVTNITMLNMTVNVTSALAYLNVWDSTDLPNVTRYEYEPVFFFANYTDEYGYVINGTCNITVDYGLTNNMTQNLSSGIYYYNRTFNATGIYYWEVSCDSNQSLPISRNDTVIINDSLPPVIRLESPDNNTNVSSGQIIFYFNVSDPNGVVNCSLILDGGVYSSKTNITMNITQNFTTQDILPGTYTCSINCTDNSYLHNEGLSTVFNLTITGAYINLTWVVYPPTVYRNDINHLFRVNVSNLGNENATNLNLTLYIPYNWSFAPGNTSVIQLGVLEPNETNTVSWYVNIGSNATFGVMTINVTANSTEQFNDNFSAFVTVGGVDLAVTSIIAPLNGTCTLETLIDVQANITNLGDNISNFTAVLEIDGAAYDSQMFTNVSKNWNVTVNFTWKPMSQGLHNVTVFANQSSEGTPGNNRKSVFIYKYFTNVTAFAGIHAVGEDIFNETIYARSNINCSANRTIKVYSFVDSSFNASSFNVNPEHNESVSGQFNGVSYYWSFNMTALNNIQISYLLQANSLDYYMLRNALVGIDPE